MKPIKLKIKAFICYAGEQIIDFTKLGENGIYLITGPTGAGKTTIFDAISYALYGEASGDARGKPEKLRSDFASNNEKTVVDFQFVSGNKNYNIRREIKPQISRETNEITKLNESVVLTLADGTMLDREKEVKAKIEEIIGLDKEQFSQIVMIAQNDFLRFLQSGTDKRVTILRHIFNTSHIKWFQERLKSLKREADDAVQLIKRDFESRDVNPYDWDNISVKITEWLENAKKQQKDIEELIKMQSNEEKKLAAEKAVAEAVAKLFKELTEAQSADKRHAGEKDRMEALQAKKLKGETALYKVKPLADKFYEIKLENSTAVKEFSEAQTAAQNAQTGLKEAEKTLANLPSLEKTEDVYNATEKKRSGISDKLEKLNTLKNRHDEIINKENAFAAMQAKVLDLQSDFNLADKEYKDLYENFIRSQAGLLAKELEDGKPCIVCGSTTHPKPATISDSNINEKELIKFQKAAEEAKNKLDKMALECAGIKSEIKTLKSTFIKDASKAIEGIEIETAAVKLNAEIKALASELTALEKDSLAQKTALEKLKSDIAAATKKQNDNSVAFASATALAEERNSRVTTTEKALTKAANEFKAALTENKFKDELDYKSAILTETTITEITNTLNEYNENGKQIKRDIARLEQETKDKKLPDIEALKAKESELENKSKELREQQNTLSSKIDERSNLKEKLTKSFKELKTAEKKFAAIKNLSDAANGKLDFETYAQIAYFERILKVANLRLKTMSQNRYALIRKAEEGDRRQRMGLEIDVFDAHTGKPRSVDSLSGGESFLASLSLALGLSDVVQQSAGNIHIDAMFIDEGFGSLDAEVLDLSIKTLSDIAGNNRIIGIISHVSELRERIDKRIDVEKTSAGSKITLTV